MPRRSGPGRSWTGKITASPRSTSIASPRARSASAAGQSTSPIRPWTSHHSMAGHLASTRPTVALSFWPEIPTPQFQDQVLRLVRGGASACPSPTGSCPGTRTGGRRSCGFGFPRRLR
jgi:hypothetical protein